MTERVNSGIIVTGGNFTARDVAVGDHAQIAHSDTYHMFAQPLADLRGAIDSFDGPSATKDALTAAHAKLAEELEAPAPDKPKLLGRLRSLTILAGSATTVIQAATALAQVIAAVL